MRRISSHRFSQKNQSSRFALCRLSRLTPWLTVLFLAILPEVSMAQTLDNVTFVGPVSGQGPSPCNSYGCCLKFTVTINSATESINIQLMPEIPGASTACLHMCCNNADATPSIDPSGVCSLSFSSTSPEYLGTGTPIVMTVFICGTNACLAQFPAFNWWGETPTRNLNGAVYNQSLALCMGNYPGCTGSGCDQIEAYSVGHCWVEVCFFSNESTPLSCFTIHLSPAPFNTATPPVWCTPNCPGPGPEAGLVMEQVGWTATLNSPNNGDITFCATSIPNDLQPCRSFCFGFPVCAPDPGHGLGSLTISLTNPTPCDGDGTIDLALKRSGGGSNGHQTLEVSTTPLESNYPNPLEASSGFKTTIPFTTTVGGTAYIRIVDATGHEVLKDNEDVTYAGQHFFYFSADRLPSGTYYYQIEFPKGVVIVNKTMLVVK